MDAHALSLPAKGHNKPSLRHSRAIRGASCLSMRSFLNRIVPRLSSGDEFEGVEQIARRMMIVLPSSAFRTSWDYIVIALVIFSILHTPLKMCALLAFSCALVMRRVDAAAPAIQSPFIVPLHHTRSLVLYARPRRHLQMFR